MRATRKRKRPPRMTTATPDHHNHEEIGYIYNTTYRQTSIYKPAIPHFPESGRKEITMDSSLFANIPQEMKERAQWVNWIPKNGKMPIDPKTGMAARTNDPTTWATFVEAVNAAPRFSGIGYVFTAADPFTGIDLDDVIDDAGNVIYDDARAIIDAANSYTEISQSGHGVHIIGYYHLQEGESGKKKAAENGKCEKEVYDRGRFFAMTGNILENRTQLRDIAETAAAIIDEIKADRETATPAASTPPQAITPPPEYAETMTRDEARAYIAGHWRDILREWTGTAKRNVNGKESYICPICGHGKGGDGLTESPRPGILKCFGCDFKGDVIQLWQNMHHVDHNEALKEMAEKCNITIKPYTGSASGAIVDGWNIKFTGHELDDDAPKGGSTMQSTPRPVAKYDAPRDFTGYYEECYRRLNSVKDGAPAIDYLQSRGISLGTAQSLQVGYDYAADPANAPGAKDGQAEKPHPARRLIIPCNKEYYTTRAIDENAVEKQYWKMYPKNEIGRKVSHVFIPEWVYAADYIFICEGIFDALSVVEAGAAAVCLNSTNYVDDLIAAFDARRPAGTCLICLDNDQAGNMAAEKLENGFNLLTIPHARADICLGCKDPNEALVKDRAAFVAAVNAAQETTTTPDGIGSYIESGAYDRDIANIIPPIPTGFNHLDQKSGGGIKSELYIISAPSSMGKTTFCLQLARQLAESGRDVLYIAMEQTRPELVNKCIASICYEIDKNLHITAGDVSAPQTWHTEIIQAARERLVKKVGNRLSIVTWNLDATTEAIEKYILKYRKDNQDAAPPVVFIDYLQLIQGKETGRAQLVKDIVSETVYEMKKISSMYNIPIICIASQARACYEKPFEMGNIKETGNAEYTAGIVWGLQYTEIEERARDKTYEPDLKKLKLGQKPDEPDSPREVTLTCDKNRGYVGTYQVNFLYHPAFDYFEEAKKQEVSPYCIRFN